MAHSKNGAETLFKRLDVQLFEALEEQYFLPPREFKSLIEVLAVVGEKIDQGNFNSKGDDLATALKSHNPAYNELLYLRGMVNEIIEEVVTFENGGLNTSVDAMVEVVKESERAREDMRTLRESSKEIRAVLTSKRRGQIPLKDLWFRKVELSESLRILKDLDFLRNTPAVVTRAMQQRRYLSSVSSLDKSIGIMFNEDLVAVGGLSHIREQLLDLKENVLETVVLELQQAVLGTSSRSGSDSRNGSKVHMREEEGEDEDDDEAIDLRHSTIASSRRFDANQSSSVNLNMSMSSYGRDGLAAVESKDGWGSMSLEGLDESVEDSLPDPSSSGGLFVRLLIRSVGLLRCEDDVERLLLENVGNEFKKGVRLIRSQSIGTNVQQYGTNVSDTQFTESQSKHFTEFIENLLNSSLCLLERLFYVLRLLSANKKLRNGEKNYLVYTIKEMNKKSVLAIWAEIEDTIVQQLKMHFVERGVVDISDDVIGSRNDGVVKKKDAAYGANTDQSNPFHGIEEGDEDLSADLLPIFAPSARLAASVYKEIVHFNDCVRATMVDEGIERQSAAGANNGSSTRSSATGGGSGHFEVKVGMSVMETLKAQSEESVAEVSAVLAYVKIFLEEELLPVIQSAVNEEMRVCQNPDNFSLPLMRGSESKDLFQRRGTDNDTPTPLSLAVQSCANTAKPLFKYWLRLPQHKDMVLTILDRLVRSFTSSAREELDAVTYKLLAGESIYKKAVQLAVRTDASFQQYRQSLYGGCTTVDEIVNSAIGESAPAPENVKSAFPGPYSAGVSGGSGCANAVVSEIEGWGVLWSLRGQDTTSNPRATPQYAANPSRMCGDFQAITTIASISYGCDWLVGQISRACATTAKKISQNTTSERGRDDHFSSSLHSKRNIVGSKLSRQEVQDLQVQLWQAMRGSMKELSKLAEEGLALLRGEMQIACFYHLHHISLDKNQDPEAIIQALIQHLLSVLDALMYGTTGDALSTVVSPLCYIVPRVFLRCLQLLSAQPSLATHASHTNKSKDREIEEGKDSFTFSDSHGDNGQGSAKVIVNEDRARLLHSAMSCQQSLSLLLDSRHIEPSTYRRLKDALAEEFERLRKYFSLLDLGTSDLKEYIESNPTEYSEQECNTLWSSAIASTSAASDRFLDPRLHNFENFWKSCHSSILIVPSSSPTVTASATPSKMSILFPGGGDDDYDDSDPYGEKSFGEKFGNNLVDDSEGSVGKKTSILGASIIEFRDPYEDDDDVGLIEGFRDKNSSKEGIIENKKISNSNENPYRVKNHSESDDGTESKNHAVDDKKYENNSHSDTDKNRSTSAIIFFDKDNDLSVGNSNRSNVSKLFGSEDYSEKVEHGNGDKSVVLKSTSTTGSQHYNPFRK